MNSKQWAVFFVTLLSFDYATATFFGNYQAVSKAYGGKDGYYGWSEGCRCNEDLTSSLDVALTNVKRSLLGKFKSGCRIKDTNLEEYEFNNGRLKGFHKFEREGPYRCSLSRDYVRIYLKIRFVDIIICYSVSLIEDILGGFLGGVVSVIGHIFGSVTNFLFRFAVSDLYCTVVLIKKFEGGGGFIVEGLYLNEIKDVSFLDKRFSKHKSSMVSYIKPVCDHVLRNTFNDNFKGELTRHVTTVSVKKESFYYESSTRKSSGGDYEASDESGGDYSYKYESSDSSSYD